MKVLYDYQILRMQKFGGISRYFYELSSRLSQYENCDIDISCVGNINYYFKKNKSICSISPKINRWIVRDIIDWTNKNFIKRKLHGRYDIFHPTYFDPYMVGENHKKMVVTVYDMIHELYPSYFRDNVAEQKRKTIHEADHIIAISESTKIDLMNLYGDIPEEKVSVIYIGTNMEKCTDIEMRKIFPKRYILFVGQRGVYKNFDTFVAAVCPLLHEDSDLRVVCTGGGAFSEHELNTMGLYSSRFQQINCDDKILSAAYTFAKVFVFPSKYEGFGIPTLEAFSCECPVVLSKTSSMPEVGGDAALYFDPESVQDMNDKIRKVLMDKPLCEELVEKGKKQARADKFNWDVIAEQTFNCYREVAQ